MLSALILALVCSFVLSLSTKFGCFVCVSQGIVVLSVFGNCMRFVFLCMLVFVCLCVFLVHLCMCIKEYAAVTLIKSPFLSKMCFAYCYIIWMFGLHCAE